MNRIYSLVFGALAALAGFTLQATELSAQKAAIYCAEATGCGNVANALAGSFPGGVDRVFNGTSGTVDIRTADMSQYAVFFVPSLSDNGSRQPYALLRDATVAAKLKSVLTGRVAVWSGTPDQGKASRDSKDQLIRNLAQYAAAEYATTKAPGLVVLQDASATMSTRYNWLAGISGRSISADPAAKAFGAASALTDIGTKVIGGLAYGNMASFGLTLPGGSDWVAGASGKETSIAFNGITSTGALGMSGAGVVNTAKAMWAAMFNTSYTVFATSNGSLTGNTEISVGVSGTTSTTSTGLVTATAGQAVYFKAKVVTNGGKDVVNCGTVAFSIQAKTANLPHQQKTSLQGGKVSSTGEAASTIATETLTSGDYTVEVAYTSGDNCKYSSATYTPTLTVAGKSKATITLENLNHTFDNTAKAAKATTDPAGLTVVSVTYKQGETAVAAADVKNAGSYTVTATLTNDSYEATPATGTLTIAKANQAALNLTSSATSAGFNGTVTFTAAGGTGTGAITFSKTEASVCAMDGTPTTNADGSVSQAFKMTSGTGSCDVTASKAGDSNYNGPVSSAQVSVKAGKAAATITLSELEHTYNGEAKAAKATTNPAGLTVVSISYTDKDNKVVTSPTSAGSYAVVAKLANDNYEATDATGTLTINKAAQTITWSNPANITFGTALGATQLNATALGGAVLTYLPASGAGLSAGTHSLKVTAAATDNYLAAEKTVSITVDKANPTVTATGGSFTYTGSPQAGSGAATGVNSDALTPVTLSYNGTGETTYGPSATAPTAAGTYTVTASFAGDANYNAGSSSAVALTITKAELAVKADDKSKTYGDANPTFTGSVTGIKNGDAITGSYTSTADAMTGVGTAVITAAAQGTAAVLANYNVTATKGTLTITAAPLSVKADDKSMIQGETVPGLTGTVTGVKNDDAITGSYSTDATGMQVGPFVIKAGVNATAAVLANYGTPTVVNGTLTVTANSKPTITSIEAPLDPQQLGTTITAKVTFEDADATASAPYTMTINWGDGSTPSTVQNIAGPGTVSSQYKYSAPGVYRLTVTVQDKISTSDPKIFEYVVIFDPNGGFVTGAGSIISPIVSSAEFMKVSDRAHFGFVSKYVQGKSSPTGNTRFQFKAGGLDFSSTSYETLVVSGDRAQYWGTGTVNGQSGYTFRLTAVDAQVSGSTEGKDKFRMEIWRGDRDTGTKVYDNQWGAAQDAGLTTAIENGNISIKK